MNLYRIYADAESGRWTLTFLLAPNIGAVNDWLTKRNLWSAGPRGSAITYTLSDEQPGGVFSDVLRRMGMLSTTTVTEEADQ